MKEKSTISDLIEKMITWKSTLILAIVLAIVVGVVLPEASSYVDFILNGEKRVDILFYYSVNDFYDTLEIYGHKGRVKYIFFLLSIGFICSVFYAMFLFSIIWLLPKKNYIKGCDWLVLLPLISFVCYLIENIGITFLLFQFPSKYEPLVLLFSVFNVMKWVALGASILWVILGFVYWFFSLIENKKQVVSGNR